MSAPFTKLYPTIEDQIYDEHATAQAIYEHRASAGALSSSGSNGGIVSTSGSLYPQLDEYMGLSLDETNAALARQYAATQSNWRSNVIAVAPLTGSDIGIVRAEIKQGIRELQLYKDGKGLVGLTVQAVDKGVFVSFVATNSPAAKCGLRFGDQILAIDGNFLAGWSMEKVHKLVKNGSTGRNGNPIRMQVRDRPFERTITMLKDSTGHIGFVFRNGKITHLVENSSAARNGLLIEHQLVEIDGINVVGLNDKDVATVIQRAGETVTVTVMPNFVYDHIVKKLGSSLKRQMDHSVPDL